MSALNAKSSHMDVLNELGYNSKRATPEEAKAYKDLVATIPGYVIGPIGKEWLGENTNTNTNYSGIPRYSSNYNYKPNNSPYTKPMSIWDAYNKGTFGRSKIDEGLEEGSEEWNKQNAEVEDAKRNRNYMIIDAISKGLRGIGKDISNVGAAYTGGTMQDSTPETSLWEARNEELTKQGISAEEKNIGGSDAAFNAASKEAEIMGQYKDLSSKELALEMDNMKLIMPREYRNLYENADHIKNPILRSAVRGSAAAMLDKYVNGGQITAAEIIGSIIANGGNELAKAAEDAGKSVEDYVADGIKSLTGGMLSDGTTVNANIGLPFGSSEKKEDTTPAYTNPYTAEKRNLLGGHEVEPFNTYKNMRSTGFLEGTPYENLGSMGQAYSYAKKHDGYTGTKDEAFTDWLYKRFANKGQQTYEMN